MIWLNFLRDLRETVSRLVSVIIITAIAVMIYVGLNGILYNVDLIVDGYFHAQNVADYWITGTALDQSDCRALSALPGVTGVQPRVTWEAREQGDKSVTLLLYAVPQDPSINRPYTIEGTLPADGREMAVSDVFAEGHGLSVGDYYDMTLAGTNKRLHLRICGLVKSPECIRLVSAATPSPELERYGFAYLEEDALGDLLGEHIYNQICLTTSEGTDDGALRRGITGVLGVRCINILSLEDNPAAYDMKGMTNNLAPIIRMFPVLFFLCAVLLMVSNMSRLIENARPAIGTFKALGYQDATILRYYLLYAVLVVLAGFPLGVLPSRYLILLIVRTLAGESDLPPYTVVPDPAAWCGALVLTAICCIGSAYLVCRSLIRESPAQCMRPKPPASTKPVLLEHVGILWQRLGFNQKYIIRNSLRNKARMFTCMVGIAFCMALVVAAFALRDSLTHYADAMSTNQNRYDLMVSLSPNVSDGQYRRLECSPLADQVEFEMSTACWLYSENRMATPVLTIAEDAVSLKRYEPYVSGALSLPMDGMLLEASIAEELGVSPGDRLMLRFTGDARFYTVTVAQISHSVTGAYMGRSAWRSLGRPYTPTAAYLTTSDRGSLEQELERYDDFVGGYQSREAVTAAAAERLTSGSLVAYILILFGGGLACVVIYNLGIMSFYEQLRSLATLMVLGFHDHEIRQLQLSENIVFALAGIIAGLPLGILLSYVFVAALDSMPLEVATTPLSYLLSCGITLLFALAVNAVIGRKMRTIDMLGALKSVE